MKKQNIYFLLFAILVISIAVISNLNPNSFTDEMIKSYFPKKMDGIVNEIKTIKGGTLLVTIINKEKKYQDISINNNLIHDQIDPGVYFEKTIQSNECLIKKGDSILFFDCYIFSREDSSKINKVKTWNNVKNKWILDDHIR